MGKCIKLTKLFIVIYIGLSINSYFTTTLCLIRGSIGVPCPACGLTRSYKYLLQGNVAEAFRAHPLFLLPILVVVLIALRRVDLLLKYQYVLFGLVLVVYVYRMIVYFPHTSPMLYNEYAILPRLLQLFQ
ncbi:MAG: DUF2752 domain-containing protein [Cellulosilyticaceae bacterium]